MTTPFPANLAIRLVRKTHRRFVYYMFVMYIRSILREFCRPKFLLLLSMYLLSNFSAALNCTTKRGFKLCEIPFDLPPHPADYGDPVDRNISRPRKKEMPRDNVTLRQSETQFLPTFIGEVSNSQKQAIQYCMALASETWDSSIPVTVRVNFSDMGNNLLLGSAQPSRSWIVNEFICPVALAEAVVAEDLNVNLPDQSSFDILMTLNTRAKWYDGTDAKTPRGHFDLVTVCLHEIHHGLFMTGGNIGIRRNPVDQSYHAVFFRENVGGRFDAFMANQDDCQISAYSDSPQHLGTVLTGNNLWFSSEGERIGRLHAPTPFISGSSLYHLSESTYGFSGDDNDLMTPAIGSNYGQHNVGTIISQIQALMLDIDAKPGAKQCATVNAPVIDNTPIIQPNPNPNGEGGENVFTCGDEGFRIALGSQCINGWIIVGAGVGGFVLILVAAISVSSVVSTRHSKSPRGEGRRREWRTAEGYISETDGNAGGLV